MSGSAIVMMLVAMLVLWGGLAWSIIHLMQSDRATAAEARRDL